jgi:hypothetical protein
VARELAADTYLLTYLSRGPAAGAATYLLTYRRSEETMNERVFPPPHSQPRALRHTTVLSNIMFL